MWTVAGLFCLILGTVAGQFTSSCRDLNTDACALFQQSKPDLCSDPSFANSTCVRFCGNCPMECFSCLDPVRDPTNCNTTNTCLPDETCMLKHLTASDGHHEYIMSCEKKSICDGFGLGFVFGRRDVDVDVNTDHLGRRDVSISCCNTDFCNLPETTTTASSMCDKDIVFVLDDSGSVGTTNFRKSTNFVEQIINGLTIGPNNAKVALLTYSTHSKVEWNLNSYPTKSSLLTSVRNVTYHGGSTNTYEALYTVRTKILTSAGGDRLTHDNVVVLISDGVSSDRQHTLQEASQLQHVTRDIITILVGSTSSDQVQMTAIATDSHHAFDIRSYGNLQDIVQQVLALICRP